MSDISTILGILQAKHKTITGIRTAPTKYPAALNAADCPMVLVWPGQARHERWTIGDRSRTFRTAVVRCYTLPVAQGTSADEGLQRAITLLDRFVDLYLDPEHWFLEQGYDQTVINLDGTELTDTGTDGRLVYAGVTFYGFEIRVPLLRTWG